MAILVDTSTMIDWLKNTENPKTQLFDKVLDNAIPFGISVLTYHEILQGARNANEYSKLKSYLETQKIYYLPHDLDFHNKASNMYITLRGRGKTIRNTIDIIVAMTAIYHKLKLLHSDRDFDVIADEVKELKILEAI